MNIPRVRITLRQLMVAVAGVAIMMGAARAGWHSYDCWRISRHHGILADISRLRCGSIPWTAEQDLAWEIHTRKRFELHKQLERRYLRAAWHPWEPIPPDLPYPEL